MFQWRFRASPVDDAASQIQQWGGDPRELAKEYKRESSKAIFEGFSSNGLQIRIQRNELRILTPIKSDFDDLF